MLNPPALHIPRKQQRHVLFVRIRGGQELVAIDDVKDNRDTTDTHGDILIAIAVETLRFGLGEIGREIKNYAFDAEKVIVFRSGEVK